MAEFKTIKAEDLNLPKAPAQAPQIDWGREFEEDMEDAHKIRYLKKLASALNYATDLIQNERNDCLLEIGRMKECVENAESAVTIQKAIVLTAITGHNQEKQDMIAQLQELEATIKMQEQLIARMENGDYRRLGK